MQSWTDIALFATTGAVLAGLYLGALWLTVVRLPSVRAPLMLLFISTVLRLALLLGAFALLTGMEWTRLAVCFAGFFTVRLLTIAWLQPAAPVVKNAEREAS